MNRNTTSYYNDGSSDKVHEVFVEPKDDGCIVLFAYGRRGATLQTGIKTPKPVSAEDAARIFEWLVKKKKQGRDRVRRVCYVAVQIQAIRRGSGSRKGKIGGSFNSLRHENHAALASRRT